MRVYSILLLAALSQSCASADDAGGEVTQEAEESAAEGRRGSRWELAVVRDIENHRLLGDARLAAFTRSGHAVTAAAALVAIGRIGDTSLEPEVRAALEARPLKAARVRSAAAFALGLLGGGGARRVLTAELAAERDADVRAALASALGRAGTKDDVATLATIVLGGDAAEVRGAAAQALGTVAMHASDPIALDAALITGLLAMAKDESGPPATRAAFALAMTRGAGTMFPEADTLAAFAGARDASARRYLARIVRRVGSDAAATALFDALAHDRDALLRAQAATQIGRLGGTTPAIAALQGALGDGSSLVVEASLAALRGAGTKAAAAAPSIAALARSSRSAWLRASALAALVSIDPVAARPLVDAALARPSEQSGMVAVGALATYGTTADLALLVPYVTHADFKVATAAVNAAAALPADKVTPALKDALRAAIASHDQAVVAAVAAAAQAFAWADFAADLRVAYDAFAASSQLDTRVAILGALAVIGSSSDVALVTRALDDSEHTVAAAAAAAYKALTGGDPPRAVRSVSAVSAAVKTPSARTVERALSRQVLLWTTRGPITLALSPEAPLTATAFVTLVERGFYDGTSFHRIIPDFVAQGGDPRGDGNGGAESLVREEIGAPHVRGSVGMATSGKDTGSSQFFFNHGYNVHLDDAYTAFAAVTSGLDVVERLEIGDEIFFALSY